MEHMRTWMQGVFVVALVLLIVGCGPANKAGSTAKQEQNSIPMKQTQPTNQQVGQQQKASPAQAGQQSTQAVSDTDVADIDTDVKDIDQQTSTATSDLDNLDQDLADTSATA